MEIILSVLFKIKYRLKETILLRTINREELESREVTEFFSIYITDFDIGILSSINNVT